MAGEGYRTLHYEGSQYVVLPPELSRALGKKFSFELWFYLYQSDLTNSSFASNLSVPSGETAFPRPLISRVNTKVPSPTNLQNDFRLQVNPQGYITFSAGGGAALGFLMTSLRPINATQWYHVAIVFDYDNEKSKAPRVARMFITTWDSSNKIYTETHSQDWLGPGFARFVLTTESIQVGRYFNNDPKWPQGQYFWGRIDELRFWKGARAGANFRSFALRTVGQTAKEPWTKLLSSGGSSPDLLLASYNFNEESGITLHDQTLNRYHGTVRAGPLNLPITWSFTNVYFVAYRYISGRVPTLIPFFAWDEQNPETYPSFEIAFTPNEIRGALRQWQPSFEGFAEKDIIWVTPAGLKIPSWGGAVLNGSKTDYPGVVFIPNPDLGNGTRFYYRASIGDSTTRYVEVRIIYDCLQPGDYIDACGICNGFNNTIDGCGVCFGDNSTCSGCDYVAFSNTTYDLCGICGGNNECVGCDGVPFSGIEYDYCGVCGGTNLTCLGCDQLGGEYDLCGVCNGDNSTCIGCDGLPASGLVYDDCGVCGGNNGSCKGCDGSGGGEYDACGVCRGDNSTCGGCDGLGGEYDACGVCDGDNSTCTCVNYHGYNINELDYYLMRFTFQKTIEEIDSILNTLNTTLALFEHYNGDADVAQMVLFNNEVIDDWIATYEDTIDDFSTQLDYSLGLESIYAHV